MRQVLCSLAFVLLIAPSAGAVGATEGSAYQVADIAPNTPVRNQGGWVLPGFFQPVSGGDVFLTQAGTGHPSIWLTDGTPEGTRPVVAGAAIGNGELIGSNGERAYFAAFRQGGTTALWATDGTPSGTVLLAAGLTNHYDGFYTPDRAVLEGQLFFHDCPRQPVTVCELWTSDGTLEGTRELVELGHRARFAGSAGVVYFIAPSVDDFRPALWRTDGTASGTIRLRTFGNDGPSQDVASVGGEALAVAEGKLWITSGNAVHEITGVGTGAYVSFLQAAVEADVLYFLVAADDTLTVWRSDGTHGGTSPVLSVPVAYSPSMPRTWVQRHGSRVYYLVPGPQSRDPYALWSSGTGGEGAQPVICGGCSSVPIPGWIRVVGDDLFFPATAGDVHTLWAMDSSQVPRAVKPYCTGHCHTEAAVEVGDIAMFPVSPTPGDDELWVTDGSAAGTRSVGAFKSFGYLYASKSFGGVFFAASPERGQETGLWMSRGAPETTVPLSAVEGDGSEPRDLRRAGGRVAFLACREPAGLWGAGPHEAELVTEGHVGCTSTSGFHPFVSTGESAFFERSRYSGQSEVWATDGTAGSTRKVWDNAADGGFVREMAAFGSDLLFWTSRTVGGQALSTLWQSDGTDAGTSKRLDLPLGVAAAFWSTELGGELYFGAQSPLPQVWRTDGTSEGTRRLTDEPIGAFFQDPEFTRVGGAVYFTGGRGIWRTNGTAAGTWLAIAGPEQDDPYGDDRLSWLHEQGGALLFMRTEKGVSTLWRTQGTLASTQQIATLQATTWPPRSTASYGGLLYFAADDGERGVELWCTDGTAAGTRMVRDIGPGPISGNPRELVVARGKLYFTADDPFTGSELWVSDGSTAGTQMVQDIAPDAASSSPADLTLAGDLLYFSADDAVTGRELWALPVAAEAPAPPAGPYLTSPKVPGFRFKVRIAAQGEPSRMGVAEPICIPETLCVSGALPGRSEVFVRVVGPKPNGRLWPTLVKFTTSRVEIWIEQLSTGELRYYDLQGAAPGYDVLPGSFDREGFEPRTQPGTGAATGNAGSVGSHAGSASEWSTSSALPGFRFRIEISTQEGQQSPVQIESDCIEETVCFSGALPGRSELFLRIVGPKPNGYLWPTLVRFSTSTIDVWLEQLSTGAQRHYRLEGATPGSSDLSGLFDRTGFGPDS